MSKLEDNANRENFVRKEMTQAQQAELEATSAETHRILMTQKRDREKLLLQIFPAKVARELMNASQASQSLMGSLAVGARGGARGEGRTRAESFTGVTIVFTDIVGFTAMSQQSQPVQVMEFLDKLFGEIDLPSSLTPPKSYLPFFRILSQSPSESGFLPVSVC